MPLDNRLHDRESQAAAAGRLSRGVHLVEPFEDQRQVLLGNARARYRGPSASNPSGHDRAPQTNLAALRCVAQRVGGEVLQRLLETVGIADDVLGARIH